MADQDATERNPFSDQNQDYDSPRRKSGSNSGCLKAFLIIGGLGFFCVLVCCGAGAYIAYLWMPKLTSNPAEVVAIGKSIFNADLPEGFEGQQAMTMDNTMMKMQIASFQKRAGDGRAQMLMMELKMANADMSRGLEEGFRNQQNGQPSPTSGLTIMKSETRKVTIDGKEANFRFSEAENPAKTKYRVVDGQVASGNKVRNFEFSIEEDAYDEEAIEKFLEELK